MLSVSVLNGKIVVVEKIGLGKRILRFVRKPLVRMVLYRDLIAAILRREVREKLKK